MDRVVAAGIDAGLKSLNADYPEFQLERLEENGQDIFAIGKKVVILSDEQLAAVDVLFRNKEKPKEKLWKDMDIGPKLTKIKNEVRQEVDQNPVMRKLAQHAEQYGFDLLRVKMLHNIPDLEDFSVDIPLPIGPRKTRLGFQP